jgi:predicted signal transduction protein with EAL and GGDEF domain
MTVPAEGIETEGRLEHLRALGCEVGQGYLFSPAVPAGEVAAMLARKSLCWGRRLALLTSADPPLARNGARRLGS